MKHIDDLTCCRALFAGWVFAYHLNLHANYAPALGPFGAVVRHGSLGVDGFFILSGLVLAYAHPTLSAGFADARRFWAKRLVRIYPVHLAMILVLALMIGSAWLLGVRPREPDRFSLVELFRHLTLIQAWGASDRWAWNYPSWSISAEWAGYLAFPYLWVLLRRQNGIGLAVVLPLTFLGVVATRVWEARTGVSLTYDGGVLRLFPEFIAGAAILPLLPRLPALLRGHPVALAGGVAAILAAMADSRVATITALWFVLGGLFLAARQGIRPVLARVPGLRWLGEISYSFYMSFALTETLQASLWRSLGLEAAERPLLYVVSSTVLTFGLAVLAYRLVERPAMRAYAAYASRQSARAAVPARG
ncbi:MAG: acyltransferase [Alphaproteobacteria bacterium]|nr:acyltransferase [Alphaproteobacteria bacterium]